MPRSASRFMEEAELSASGTDLPGKGPSPAGCCHPGNLALFSVLKNVSWQNWKNPSNG
jgi:hypothetical protein